MGTAAVEAESWHITTVDSEGDVGNDCSIALNAGGDPSIGYYDSTHYRLRFASRDTAGWHSETVVSGYPTTGQGPSLAFNRSGTPCISYYGNADLWFAWKDSSGWHTEIADSYGDTGRESSLAFDADGNPHIAYVYEPDGFQPDSKSALRHAWKDASGWHALTLDGGAGDIAVVTHPSLAFDSQGYPHISYYYLDWPNGSLKYAWQDVSGWHSATIDSAGDVGLYTSLAFDSQGYPHVSYGERSHDGSNSYAIKYAWQDDSGWHNETVFSNDVLVSTSLALDEHDNVYFSYKTSIDRILRLAWKDADGWHSEIIDYAGGVSDHSLAIDQNGKSHVAYQKNPEEDLKYAFQNHPPVLASIGNKTVYEGNLLRFTITATDPDDSELVFSAKNLPEGSSFDPASHRFTWTPDYTDAGTYPHVLFSVSDGDYTVSEEITITVTEVGYATVLTAESSTDSCIIDDIFIISGFFSHAGGEGIAHETIRLQRLTVNGWEDLPGMIRETDNQGLYRFSLMESVRGAYSYRAFYPGTMTYAGSASMPVEVDVHGYATTITARPSTTTSPVTETFYISGTLSLTDGVPLPDEPVRLWKKEYGRWYDTGKTAVTHRDGKYYFSVKEHLNGVFTYVVRYGGSDRYDPSASPLFDVSISWAVPEFPSSVFPVALIAVFTGLFLFWGVKSSGKREI